MSAAKHVGPRDAVLVALQLAQTAETDAKVAHSQAATDLSEAEAKYLVSGSTNDEDTVSRCRMRLGRAEKLLATAATALDTAWAAVRARDHERLKAAHAEDLLTLPAFVASLDPLYERLAKIDQAAFALVNDIAVATQEAAVRWEIANERAREVGSNLGAIVKPQLADVLLYLTTRATEQREDEQREDCSELLAEPHGYRDWRTAGALANERPAPPATVTTGQVTS